MPQVKGWNAEACARRLEDLAWMADTGESASGAAERLGMTLSALERWCDRHARDLWRRLSARDPVDHNERSSRTYRRSA